MKLAIGRVNQNPFHFQRFEPRVNIVDGEAINSRDEIKINERVQCAFEENCEFEYSKKVHHTLPALTIRYTQLGYLIVMADLRHL